MSVDTLATVNDELAADLNGAFPGWMRQLQDGIYSGVRRLVPSAPDAEDITQETFIRAYRALVSYPPERVRDLNLPAWVWTIALNLCRNAARTRSRRPRTVELDRDVYHPQDGPERHALTAEENAAWEERLSRLSPPQRTAVVLRHVVGLPYRDIAEATGRAEGTVKTDVHRGLAKLQETLL